MKILLSGIVGAFFATILNILYLYVSSQKKLRNEVLLEVVAYCDEIYKNLRILHVLKHSINTKKKEDLNEDEYLDYRDASRKLTSLLTSSSPGIKLALVYGEGELLRVFNELRGWFNIVTSILRKATPDNWAEEHEGIMLKFAQQIDPLRTSFERMLLKEANVTSIIKQKVKRFLELFMNIFRPKNA